MISITPNQILLLYTWFPLATVIVILLLIARFYYHFSGDRTYYVVYLLPLFLFGAGLVRYASVDLIAGDTLGDVLIGLAGVLLVSLSLFLYRCMTAGRKI